MPGTAGGVTPSRRRDAAVLIGLTLLLLLVAAARLLVGEPIPRLESGTIDWPRFTDYLAIRRDRLLIGAIVGAALGISGALFQALLRNPLASPYILGISSGAALGVMLAWSGLLGAIGGGVFGTHTAAFAGALATMGVVYLLGQRGGWIDPLGLLLIGVIVNAINSAAIMFLNYLAPQGQRSDLVQWMMGYLNDDVGLMAVGVVGSLTLGGGVLAAWLGPAMDVASFSDEEAHGLGLHLPRLRVGLFALAGLLTSATVVLAGPIGFVGLVGPHAVRLLLGPRHRPLIAGAALAGAALLVGADAAVKAFDAYVRPIGLLPIGAVTALIGGPAFIAMLRPRLGGGP